GYAAPGTAVPAQVPPGSVPSWRAASTADQTTPRMASFELRASGRSAAQHDDEWLFDQTAQAAASTGQAWPPAPAAGRWSSSLPGRLEAAERAREQAQADAAAAAASQAGEQQQVPAPPDASPRPAAPALPEVAVPPATAATQPAPAQPDTSAVPRAREAAGQELPQRGASESPRTWASDQTGNPAEPVYRSVSQP